MYKRQVHELGQLLPVAGSAVLLTNGKELLASAPEGVLVITKKITSVNGEEEVAGVTFEDGSSLELDGLFVALGSAGAVDLARKIGAVSYTHLDVYKRQRWSIIRITI